MQLHQVQDELERIFLVQKEQAGKLDSELKKVTREWNVASQKKRDAQEQVSKLKSELKKVTGEWKLTSQKKRDTQEQVSNLKKQLSQAFKENEKLQEKYKKILTKYVE